MSESAPNRVAASARRRRLIPLGLAAALWAAPLQAMGQAQVPGPESASPAQAPSSGDFVTAESWMDGQVHAVEETVREAHFRSALGITEQLRDHPAATPAQRVRLELVRATAAVALGEAAALRESLQRILEIDPDFRVPAGGSPRLVRALAALTQSPE